MSDGRRGRTDRGAGALEYVGAVVIAVALLLALAATGVAGTLGERFACAIASLWGGGCAPGRGSGGTAARDADYEPPLCTTSTVTDKAGAKVKVGWFEWGNEYGFQDQVHRANYDVNGDGRVDGGDQLIHTTFTDSASIGATGGFGGKIGTLGKGSVDLGGGIRVNNGDTWVFESRAEADAFRGDLEKLRTYEIRRASPGGAEASMGDGILALFGRGPLVEEDRLRERIEGRLGDRHISYGSVGVHGSVEGGLSVHPGDDRIVAAGIEGSAKINADVILTKDDYRGTKSYTYSVKAEGQWGSRLGAGGFDTGDHAQAARSATVTVTRDQKTGELLRIDFTQTTESDDVGTSDGAGGHNGKEGKDGRGGRAGAVDNSGKSRTEVFTNTVAFPEGPDGDADRAVAQKWLDGNGDGGAVFSYLLNNHAPTTRPGADDPFGQLLFDRGRSSRTGYGVMADAHEYGFELNLGLSLGASVELSNKAQTLENARFLGAPRNGKREYVPYSYCAR
ncbi:hypothetical protein ACWDNT_14260 [Streptomyces sp. NPDC000963]